MARTFGYNFRIAQRNVIAIVVFVVLVLVFDWPMPATLETWLILAGYSLFSLGSALHLVARVTVDDESVRIESLLPWEPSGTIQFADMVGFSCLPLLGRGPTRAFACFIITRRAKTARLWTIGTKDFQALYELLDAAWNERRKDDTTPRDVDG